MGRKMHQKRGTSKDEDDFVFIENMTMEHRIDIPPDAPPHLPQPSTRPRRRIHLASAPTLFSATNINHHRPTPLWRFLFVNKSYIRLILFLILCFLLLWWFSSPVNLVVKDGRLMDAHTSENMSVSLKDTSVNLERLAILAVAMSPNTAV